MNAPEANKSIRSIRDRSKQDTRAVLLYQARIFTPAIGLNTVISFPHHLYL